MGGRDRPGFLDGQSKSLAARAGLDDEDTSAITTPAPFAIHLRVGAAFEHPVISVCAATAQSGGSLMALRNQAGSSGSDPCRLLILADETVIEK